MQPVYLMANSRAGGGELHHQRLVQQYPEVDVHLLKHPEQPRHGFQCRHGHRHSVAQNAGDQRSQPARKQNDSIEIYGGLHIISFAER